MLGRNDYTEIEPLPENQKAAISTLKVVLAPGMKTIFDVFRGDSFLGQVRTTFWGQFYRMDASSDFIYVTHDWNSSDPHHGHALAALVAEDQH